MKKTIVLLMIILFVGSGCAGEMGDSKLAAGFKEPGNEARPRAYWNWLNGDVTHDGLTRDLEEAKDKGLGGLDMWDTEAMRNPGGFVPAGPQFMGPESVAAMHHSMKVAKRLGMDLGLTTSSGWNAGGSWVPAEMASKNLFYTEVVVSGPGNVEQKLAFPKVPRNCPMGEDGLPKWYLDIAVLAWPESEGKVISSLSKVIDITDRLKDGVLNWDVPAGKWNVVRYVCSNNGQQLIAASPNSKGLFIDFLDPEATRFHFEYIIGKLGLKKGGDPSPLKHLEVDSMELHPGIQWSPKFGDWFKKYHGYDLIEWLPALSGWTVEDKETTERFVYDYKKTVSDLLIFSHYTTGSQVCAEYGLQLTGEAGGPGAPIWGTCPVDSLKALGNVHIPRGEFWIRHRNMFLIKEIASASHIYGKPYVDAESWTTWRRWMDSPFVRKQVVDRAFCEGLNRITYHGYSHSPTEVVYPGRTYHAGVDMNPQVVWWPKARPFMDYLTRCCYMLQQGKFVADVAYYYGDKTPNFWPEYHDVPKKPLLDGLGANYDYDVVNTDVIVNRMSVKDGRIVLPDGMSYTVLVLPDQKDMPLNVLQKLEKMVSAGAVIIGPKPKTVPGLKDYESKNVELGKLAEGMWGYNSKDESMAKDWGFSVSSGSKAYGKGKVVWGLEPKEWLSKNFVGPDFMCLTNPTDVDYIHRRTNDSDIYFVRNKQLTNISADCLFRIKDRVPQLWDPADGSINPALFYDRGDGYTILNLELEPGESVFVVFDEKGKTDSSVFQCFKNGEYSIAGRKRQKKQVKVSSLPEPLTVEGEWTVEFDPNWGGPAQIKLSQLISWTDHEDEGVKYYSGSGFYTKTLNVPAGWLGSRRRIHLDLGDVREVAEVFVNGESAGVLWKPPFRADITSLVKPGANALKIEVMNLWINRLSGDMKLPAEKRFCRTNMTSPRDKGGDEPWKIQPAGLLGPIRLLPSVDIIVNADNK